jgi:hypothetical protein
MMLQDGRCQSSVNATPQPLVVCSVYASMGWLQHADLLLRLFSNAQGQCHSLHAVDASEKIAIVHAYADGPYD